MLIDLETTNRPLANDVTSSARDIVRHVGEPNSERRRANIRSQSTKLENCDGMATGKADEGFISGYWSTIADKESKRRYADKLRLVNGSDPYERYRRKTGTTSSTCGPGSRTLMPACI